MKTVIYSTHTGLGISECEAKSENVLEIIQTGVCGSDRHMVTDPGMDVRDVGIGHEIIGRISRLGKPEELLGDPVKEGDRVVVAPGINCGKCPNCLIERRYCTDRFVYGFSGPLEGKLVPGGFSEFLPLRPHTKVFQVPDTLSDDRAVFIEIMACAVGAVEKITELLDISRIGRVLIMGAGSAGISSYAAVKALGIEVDMVEPGEPQRKLATAIGVRTLASIEDRPQTYSGVIDCAGSARSFAAGIDALKTGGCMVEFGAYFPSQPLHDFEFWKICQKEITIRGLSETQDRFFPRAIRVLETVRDVRFEEFVQGRIRISDVASLQAMLTTPVAGKFVVVP